MKMKWDNLWSVAPQLIGARVKIDDHLNGHLFSGKCLLNIVVV